MNSPARTTFSSRSSLPITIFLFVLGFGLSLLNEGLFHWDSVVLAQAVEKTYQTGILQPAVNGRYGAVLINSILYFPSFLLGQNADLTTRLSSILFHSLSVVAFFSFIKFIFNNRAQALFGSMLLAFTPLYLMPNAYGKEHGMSIFFLLISFILAGQATRENSNTKAFLAGLCYVFTINVRESLIWTLPLFVAFYFQPDITLRPFKITCTHDADIRRNRSIFLLSLAAFLGATFAFSLTGVIKAQYLKGIFWPTFPYALRDIAASTPWIALLLIFIGMGLMLRKEKIFLSLLLIAWLSLVFLYGNTIWYAPRHLDSVLIPAWIFASYALRYFYERSKIATLILVGILIFHMIIFSYPLLTFRHSFNGEKRFAEFVKAKTEPGDTILTVDQSVFINYYGKRKTIIIPLEGGKEDVLKFIEEVNRLLSLDVPVYYTNSNLTKSYEKYSADRIRRAFNIAPVEAYWREDYHRAEIYWRLSHQKLYKVSMKNRPVAQ